MITCATVIPCRGDFYATDRATSALKAAKQMREWAAAERLPSLIKVLRDEMRYYAKIAVVCARRYRACRS